MSKDKSYIKYIYWIESEMEAILSAYLKEERGTKLKYPKGVMCLPLERRYKVGCVTPEVWSQKCRRQGTWYYHSSKKGKLLVVSSFQIPGFEDMLECIIKESGFRPPRFATDSEKKTLATNPVYTGLIPDGWNKVSPVEKKWFIRFAKRLGSRIDNFEYLYMTHNANHSNFIESHLFIEESGDKVPYSIDISAHLCSACLELFQVLGENYKKKYVTPCPGAVFFGGLEPDRFLEVESAK